MSPLAVGGIGFAVLFILMALRMPIAFAMGVVGLLGGWYLTSLPGALSVLGQIPYSTTANYTLSVIPLFVLMGQLAYYSGMSRDIYRAGYQWMGHWPGGLAMATTAACAGFAAMCGSSMATGATIGHVALPEMRGRRYDPGLATGCVAAGGTLGILIPPSVAMVVYAMLTEQSIGKLLIAGVLPGILLASLFMLTILVQVKINPSLAPAGPKASMRERLSAIKGTWGMMILVVVIIGGIYLGVFTANEAAGVGAFIALLLSLINRGLTWQAFYDSLVDTVKTTAMIMGIFVGAMIFSFFLARSELPFQLANYVGGLQLSPFIVLAAIVLLYVILGCLMDAMAMVVLTVPILFPVILQLGFDPIWYGVIMVIIVEQASITPPVGLNVYVIAGIAKDVPMGTIFRGIVPFWFMMMVCIVILTAVPQIALFLPNTMR
ncbi:MAG: TRAP transporter large permease [Chloroflexota bacterium]